MFPFSGGDPPNQSAAASNNAHTDPEGLSNDFPKLSVVDKLMFAGKILSTPARLSDVDKLHMDLVRTEDGVNRMTRHLNRKINQTNMDLTELKDDTQILTTKVNTLANNHGTVQVLQKPNQAPSVNNPPILNLAIPSPIKNQNSSFNNANASVAEPTPQDNSGEDSQDEEFELNPSGFHHINMLFAETSHSFTFTIFSGTSPLEFDRWARRFTDLLDCNGRKWDEYEKLARLKACLDGEPRRIFDNLIPAHKATSSEAIQKIKENLDTPQNKELTYQALSLCKQMEGESVDDFSARLIPLIEATTADLTASASEEVLCRAFLEKLSPNLKFLTRTLSGPVRRDFKILRMNAREAEMMHREIPNSIPAPLFPISEQHNPRYNNTEPSNYPEGNHRTWAPTGSNGDPIGPGQSNRNNWDNNAQTSRGSFNTSNSHHQNDRRWNNRSSRNDRRWNNQSPQNDRSWSEN